jgi:27-O-demethylrifamycin SV methyltransferase
MWDAKHLGYYPDKKATISEKKAHEEYQNLVAEKLDLKSRQQVLDAGCGRGVTACYLSQKYQVRVTGIDVVDFEITSAKKRAKNLGLNDKTDFRVADYSQTDFPDDMFDALYANETLSHTPDLPKVFKEFFRIMKHGAKIALFEYTLAEDKFFNESDKAALNFVIDNSAMVGLKQFRLGAILPMLSVAGFINTQEIDITDHVKPSFFRLYKLAKPFYPLIKFLNLKKRFVNATAAATYYPLVEKGLIRFFIYTGQKP